MAGKRNLTCKKGDTFPLQFVISNDSTPWNLTGYTITMTVKPYAGSTTTIVQATTINGLITTEPINGRVIINIPSTTTANFPVGRHEYDIVFDSGSVVTTILEGKFIVTLGVTV